MIERFRKIILYSLKFEQFLTRVHVNAFRFLPHKFTFQTRDYANRESRTINFHSSLNRWNEVARL